MLRNNCSIGCPFFQQGIQNIPRVFRKMPNTKFIVNYQPGEIGGEMLMKHKDAQRDGRIAVEMPFQSFNNLASLCGYLRGLEDG